MQIIDIEKIENIKWRIIYCLFVDYKDYNYRETLFKYITRESFLLLKDSNLLWKYYSIIEEYYNDNFEMPDFDYLELILKDKYFNKDNTFELDYLLSKLEDNKIFIEKTKNSSYSSVLNHIKNNALDFIITSQIKALLKRANDLKDMNEVAKIAIKIQELYEAKEVITEDIIIGKPSENAITKERIFRPLGVDFLDKYIRKGRGVSEGEIVLGVIPTNQGKGLWSGEFAYKSLMLGYNTIIFNNEDNPEDTRNLILGKFFKIQPEKFLDFSLQEIKNMISEMETKINASLIICNLRDFSLNNIKNKIKTYTKKGYNNFRIIIDYFTILSECQNDFNKEMSVLKELEFFTKDNRCDVITFSQVKSNCMKLTLIEERMSAGSIDKERKASFTFSFTSDNAKIEKRICNLNFFKVRHSDEKPFLENIRIDPVTLSFIHK